MVGEKISQESKAWLVVVMFKRGGKTSQRVMAHDTDIGARWQKWKVEKGAYNLK